MTECFGSHCDTRVEMNPPEVINENTNGGGGHGGRSLLGNDIGSIAYSGPCEYRFRGDVNKDSGHVNNPNRDERGGLEPAGRNRNESNGRLIA